VAILFKTFMFSFLFPDVPDLGKSRVIFFVLSNLSKEAESKSDYRVWFGHYPTSAIVSSAPGTAFFIQYSTGTTVKLTLYMYFDKGLITLQLPVQEKYTTFFLECIAQRTLYSQVVQLFFLLRFERDCSGGTGVPLRSPPLTLLSCSRYVCHPFHR
jgi:hypothetical protein